MWKDFWFRYKVALICLIAVAASVVVLFLTGLATKDGNFYNLGFLVLGALITALALVVTEWDRRRVQRRDLAEVLYYELAHHVARCAFDAEDPWHKYLAQAGAQQHSAWVRKFTPVRPLIYEATASQITLLEGEAPQDLIYFYYRLAAWERDLKEITEGSVRSETLEQLSRRLHQTLEPGLKALNSLRTMVRNHVAIDRSAVERFNIIGINQTKHVSENLDQKLSRMDETYRKAVTGR